MSQADPALLLRELHGWDWELCRRQLPAVLPRLLISFPAGHRTGCGKGTAAVLEGGVCILRSSTVRPNCVRESGGTFVRGRVQRISLGTGTAFSWNNRLLGSRTSRVVHLALWRTPRTHLSPAPSKTKQTQPPKKTPTTHHRKKTPKKQPFKTYSLIHFVDPVGTLGYQPALVVEHPHQFHTNVRQ